MSDLLIEILSADIPARMQKKASEDFAKLILAEFDALNIPYQNGEAQSTPRRMVLYVDGLPATIADSVEERKGPKVDAPQQAIDGFLRANNLKSLDECVKKDTGKGEFWFVEIKKEGGNTKDKIKDIIVKALQNLAWPKSMNWGEASFRWARPLKSILVLFDGELVNGEFSLGDTVEPLTFTDTTVGHRFLSPATLKIKNYDDYKTKLHSAYVMVSRDQRKQVIFEEASLVAKEFDLHIQEDNALLEEIVGLIEWPVILCGQFDEEFLAAPQECLISTMKKDQKYIPLFDAKGKLANRFIITSNMVTEDRGAEIIHGNQKVLRARLSDAKFFYDQDLKTKLSDRLPKLSDIKFHEKLGKVSDRVTRLETLAENIAKDLSSNAADAKQAGRLCKADLVSGMVFEFPELQGIAGRYYALAEGYNKDVAFAIEDHYKPAGPDDACPTKPVSIAVALAEKLDVLTGFFSINEKPTGSKDPFALRRAALGIIRIVLENRLEIDLEKHLNNALDLYKDLIKVENENTVSDILNFLADRMKVALKDKGVRHDLIDAVFSLKTDGNLHRVQSRASALQKFLQTDDGSNLLAGYKRASNIVSIEEKKEGKTYAGTISSDIFTQEEENALYDILSRTETTILPALIDEKYEDVMSAMAKLRAPIDAFFDKVTVNDNNPDLRVNRLNMLSKIRNTLNNVADFSKIENQ